MKRLFYLVLLAISSACLGQNPLDEKTRPIVEEGKRLYKSEMASWYGTDLFMEAFQEKTKIGGYLSYTTNDSATCIFFSKGETPRVIGTISFDGTYNVKTAKTDLTERDFTDREKELFLIRFNGMKIITSDTLFKTYANTSLNLVPLVSDGQKKLYIMTGPKNNGVVVFGNDYLLVFDNDNKLVSRNRLHKNIITNPYGKEENGVEVTGGIHTHLPETGDFITATDICTLMLYEKFANWKQYTVVSANYMNIWDCEKNSLLVMTREAIDKINKDQEERHKKKDKE